MAEQVLVEHTVRFSFDDGEGDVLPVGFTTPVGGYARLDSVVVHLARHSYVHASGIRCRKNGEPDKRMGQRSSPVVLPDEQAWMDKARAVVGSGAAQVTDA